MITSGQRVGPGGGERFGSQPRSRCAVRPAGPPRRPIVVWLNQPPGPPVLRNAWPPGLPVVRNAWQARSLIVVRHV
jgi:hypothetical protein